MAERQSVELVTVEAPLGHELVHEGHKAGVVASFEQVDEFMDDNVLEAVYGLPGQLQVLQTRSVQECRNKGLVKICGRRCYLLCEVQA